MAKEPLEKYQYQEKLELKDLKSQLPQVLKVNCPTCQTSVAADNLNIQNNIAKCGSCDVIFSFAEQVEQLTHQHGISQEVLRPEGVELNYFQDELDISVEQPWGNFEIFLVALFPFLVTLVTAIVIKQIPPTDLAKAGMITFWVASIIGYIAYFFIRKRHKIYVHIDDLHLNVERRPRKFIKDAQYDIRDIDQVYTKNVITSNGTQGFGIFMIVNARAGQQHVELVKSVNSRSKAKYIEQEIERKLGIQDRRVPDETA
ncbi:MAG: hypothetical protein AAF573_08900 [Bacteroidota bacterium]